MWDIGLLAPFQGDFALHEWELLLDLLVELPSTTELRDLLELPFDALRATHHVERVQSAYERLRAIIDERVPAVVGVTSAQIERQQMTAVTNIGAGYWMVDEAPTRGGLPDNPIVPKLPPGAPGAGGVALKMLPPGEEATAGVDEDELNERKRRFQKWLPPVDESADVDDLNRPASQEGGQQDLAEVWATTANVEGEIWGITHMLMWLVYWLGLIICSLWQLAVFADHHNDASLPETCSSTKFFFLSNGIASLVLFPAAAYTITCTVRHLDRQRRTKIGAADPAAEYCGLSGLWMSWSTPRIFVVCLSVVVSAFQLGWFFATISVTFKHPECEPFFEQARAMVWFVGAFVMGFSVALPIAAHTAVMQTESESKRALSEEMSAASTFGHPQLPQQVPAVVVPHAHAHAHPLVNTTGESMGYGSSPSALVFGEPVVSQTTNTLVPTPITPVAITPPVDQTSPSGGQAESTQGTSINDGRSSSPPPVPASVPSLPDAAEPTPERRRRRDKKRGREDPRHLLPHKPISPRRRSFMPAMSSGMP